MEFVIGGIAAIGAGVFTNPLEVAKTRMQLQGELTRRGQYQIHYRNVFHAFYAIGKTDGLLALQKGLAPALCYQFFANGIRLGAYQCICNAAFTRTDGKMSPLWSAVAGATAGCIGAFFGSPFYMIKIQLQSIAQKEIAVGHQHKHTGMYNAVVTIYKDHGILGLWRGVGSSFPRIIVGSGTQLMTFSWCKEKITSLKLFPKESVLTSLLASTLSGIAIVAVMEPFDVIATRVYNQGTDKLGQGLLYKNTLDCFVKVFRAEGLRAFYKGWGASLFRLGPHSVLTLVFWNQLTVSYKNVSER